MRFQNAIFDFDGTLFDSMFLWETLGEAFLRSQGRVPRPGLRDALRPMSMYQSAVFLKREYDLPLTPEEITCGVNAAIEGFYLHEVQPKPGVPGFLEALSGAGVRMAIATASDRAHVEGALHRCGLDSFFDGIFTCTEVEQGKDTPLVFRHAMKALGGDRDNTILFEDAIHAIRTAKDDGFFVAGVQDESEGRQEEVKQLCDIYLPDFLHIDTFWKAASE